jgi:hypothetical protein
MKLQLLAPVLHDGKNCSKGDVIDVADVSAQRLIKLGFAAAVDGAAQGGGNDPNAQGGGNEGGNGTPQNPADPNAGESLDINKMTIDELALQLSSRGVGFKKNATRDQLAALLREALGKQG